MKSPEATPGRASRVVAIVPAKDRADSVGATVRALRSIQGLHEVAVVDDGSTDATADAARQAGASVIRLPRNAGKGGAVAAGVAAVADATVYLLIDADLGDSASAAAALLDPVTRGEADMAIGSLPAAGGRGGFGLVRRLAGWGIRRATTPRVFVPRSPLSGQRAVEGELMRGLELAPRFGMEVALTIDAVRAGARVVEVDVAMDHRHTGRKLSGFLHRGRQGIDIARALWPRITKRGWRSVLIVMATLAGVALALWLGSGSEPSSSAPASRAGKVLLIGVPGLEWDDLQGESMPNLKSLLERGAVAAMTVRTLSQTPQVVEGYATLGAGSRVRAGNRASAVTVGDEGNLRVDGAAVRRHAGRHVPSLPGALGDALHAAGATTAVVGSADTAPGLTGAIGVPAERRPVAVALMDRKGVVDGGLVSGRELLVPAPRAPFGERADLERVAKVARDQLARHDVVLVDSGDMHRVRDLAELGALPGLVRSARLDAIRASDDLIGRLTQFASPATLVIVVSVVPPAAEWRLAPVVATGPGVVRGYLHSPSTKRLGLVTLTDIAPTVLDALSIGTPPEMIGHPLRYHAARPDISRLSRLDRDAAFREQIYYPAALGFIAAQAVAYALVLRYTRRRSTPAGSAEQARKALVVAMLAIAAFPLSTFLFRAVPFGATTGELWVAVVVGIDAALVAVASRFRRHVLSPLAVILGMTAWVLLVDVTTGARLQNASIMGYSPHTAARFFGLGNTAFAVLASTAILSAALHLQHSPRRREALLAVAAFFVMVVAVDGAPVLGDDVGGMLTLVPVLGLTLLAFYGRRITWRTLGAVAAITVLVVSVAAAIDLIRPAASRTHLGRVISDTLNHGSASLFTTMARKASVSLQILRSSIWTWTIPVIAGFLLFILVIQRRGVELLPFGSPARVGVVAALASGVLGALVNDSGVIVTAMALVFVGPVVATIALSGNPEALRVEAR